MNDCCVFIVFSLKFLTSLIFYPVNAFVNILMLQPHTHRIR